MANETTVTTLNDLVTTAYDLAAWKPLRAELVHEQFATVKSTNQSHNGATVQFTEVSDLTLQTSPLNEISDPAYEALTSTPITVSLAEYGHLVTTTAKVRGTSFIPVDPVAAERVGWNAGASIDEVVRLVLAASSLEYGPGAGDPTSNHLRAASAKFRSANVPGFYDAVANGGAYAAIIHPDQEYAFRVESDAAGWRYYQQHQNPAGGTGSIAAGQIGTYEGFKMIVSSRVGTSGSGGTKEYTGLLLGKDALAKAYSRAPGFGQYPQVVAAAPIDGLQRHHRLGWYVLVGYGIFRSVAVAKFTSQSPIN
jgi:N4-gp56 family major capsid protein